MNQQVLRAKLPEGAREKMREGWRGKGRRKGAAMHCDDGDAIMRVGVLSGRAEGMAGRMTSFCLG